MWFLLQGQLKIELYLLFILHQRQIIRLVFIRVDLVNDERWCFYRIVLNLFFYEQTYRIYLDLNCCNFRSGFNERFHFLLFSRLIGYLWLNKHVVNHLYIMNRGGHFLLIFLQKVMNNRCFFFGD